MVRLATRSLPSDIRSEFFVAALAKRDFSFTNPLVEESYHFIFIHTAVLCLEHIHNPLVIPRQMLFEQYNKLSNVLLIRFHLAFPVKFRHAIAFARHAVNNFIMALTSS